MLLSDMWQPAVLQLLPFSANDACTPQPLTTRLTSLTSPDTARGFPVLAVTRSAKDGAGGGAEGAGEVTHSLHADSRSALTGGSHRGHLRAASERLSRSQVLSEGPGGSVLSQASPHPRAKSDYLRHRSAASNAAAARHSGGGRHQSRGEQPTCHVTDLNERIVSRAALRADSSSSPDSCAASQRTGHCPSPGDNGDSGLPKPAFPANSLSATNCPAVGVMGSGPGSPTSEGRYLVNKNGMWRSVTMTPGEMELKKHRDHMDKLTGVKQAFAAENKQAGYRYHKMNVRDLPRSNTPVNDHDPDKLNMKQVIAFLQSKGKSQADAVELPREVKAKVTQGISLPQATKQGVLKGSVRKTPASSTAAELVARAAARRHGAENGAPKESPKGEGGSASSRGGGDPAVAQAAASPSSGHRPRDRLASRSRRSTSRDPHHQPHQGGGPSARRPESYSPGGDPSPRRSSSGQRRPFRLHRFLTMVPSARECAPLVTSAVMNPTSSSSTTNNSGIRIQAASSSRVAGVPSSPEPLVHTSSGRQERTLCLDLAKCQSPRSLTAQPRGERRAGQGQAGSEGRAHYRLSGAGGRPRPSSLRVEQDHTEADRKLSADFGGDRDRARDLDYYDNGGFRFASRRNHGDHSETRFGGGETKAVIRLPFVLVDSEEEDAVEPSKRGPSPQKAAARSAKGPRPKPEKRKAVTKPTKSNVDVALWATPATAATVSASSVPGKEVVVRYDEMPLVESSVRSSAADANEAHARSVTSMSLSMVSHSDFRSDQVQVSEDSLDARLPTLAADMSSNQHNNNNSSNNSEVKDGEVKDRSVSPTKIKVNIPGSRNSAKKHDDSATVQKTPEVVTLSLRKERNRTRERTYMSEIGGSDVFSDDTCAARVNSESVRMSLKSDDLMSWAS